MSAVGLPEVVLIEDSMDDEFLSLRGIQSAGIDCHITIRREMGPAIELLRSDFSPIPSLFVVDFSVPRFSGLDMLTEIRRNERIQLVPVVVLSGGDPGLELAECYRFGANSCVVKPYDAKQYVDHLSQIVCYWLTVNCAFHRSSPHAKRVPVDPKYVASPKPLPA